MGDVHIDGRVSATPQAEFAKFLRTLADQIDAGEIQAETLSIRNDFVDGPPEGERRTFRYTGMGSLSFDYRVKGAATCPPSF